MGIFAIEIRRNNYSKFFEAGEQMISGFHILGFPILLLLTPILVSLTCSIIKMAVDALVNRSPILSHIRRVDSVDCLYTETRHRHSGLFS